MKRKQAFYIVFFLVLVVGFYVVLANVIPGFTKSKYPAIANVKPFSFVNQDGRKVTQKDVEGKVYVANYFFTTCKGICPKMNGYIKSVHDELKGEKDFLILSHTSDPAVDSVPVLKRYAELMGAGPSWIFLTGRKDSLYTQARLSYKIDDPQNNLRSYDDDFLHTQFLALVNHEGEVVKIYDGLKKSEVDQLVQDARQLLKQND